MKLDLINIVIKNFASITNSVTLEVESMGPGLHFVRGRNRANKRLGANGVGKSTIFAALCWALYGRTPDGLRNTDIEPWVSEKKRSIVKVTFRLDDKQNTITRTTHPNRLTFNSKDVSQEYIDKRLCMNFSTFTNSVLAGQDHDLFLDRTPSDKLALFSEVLELDRWNERSKRASKDASKLSTEIEVLESRVASNEAALKEATEGLVRLKDLSDNFDNEREQKISIKQKELKKEQRRLDEIKPRHEQAQLELEQAMEVSSIQDQLAKVTRDLQTVEKNKVEFDIKIGHAIRDRNNKTLELEELRIAKICPTCKQKIQKKHTLKHRLELKRQIAQLSKIMSMGVPPRTIEAIEEFREKRDKLTKALQQRQKRIDAAQSVILVTAPDLAQAQQRVYALTTEIQELHTADNPHYSNYTMALRFKKRKRAELDHDKKELRLKRRRYARTKFWIKGFKDIRLMIVHETLKELELATNAMLEVFGLIGWAVKYDVEKETKAGTIKRGMSVSILSPYNDKPVKWESWSGGEKQRLRLIGTFALSDVLLNRAGIEPSFEIFDEQSKFLSSEGVTDMVDALADRAAQTKKTIFLIDHTTIESSRFASTTTITRSKDGTRTITS